MHSTDLRLHRSDDACHKSVTAFLSNLQMAWQLSICCFVVDSQAANISHDCLPQQIFSFLSFSSSSSFLFLFLFFVFCLLVVSTPKASGEDHNSRNLGQRGSLHLTLHYYHHQNESALWFCCRLKIKSLETMSKNQNQQKATLALLGGRDKRSGKMGGEEEGVGGVQNGSWSIWGRHMALRYLNRCSYRCSKWIQANRDLFKDLAFP